MGLNLLFASTYTLGILASFVFFIIYLIAFWAGAVDIWVLVSLTIGTNVMSWLISPYMMDLLQKIFYKVSRVSFDEFKNRHSDVAAFIESTCAKNNIRIPQIRIIHDNNPTAYCYGSFHQNARIVISEGIFKYLDTAEQKAVIAHEIGHIVNKDFIVMTIAATLLQVLYEIHHNFMKHRRSSRNGKNDLTPIIGAIAYVFYMIGSYLILYLSRTREYLADRFSAEATGNPDALSMALVKIAYGIASEVDTASTQRLLASTRVMGIYDFKAAQSLGTTFKIVMNKTQGHAAEDISKVFLFDIYSPWAAVLEIHSTHPLTGKRIRALSNYAKERHRTPLFDFEKVAQEGAALNRGRLYSGFITGIFMYALPFLALFSGIVYMAFNPSQYPISIGLFGLSLLAVGLYMFQQPGGIPEKTTVFELMQDPYANPLTGRYVELEGNIIGKADAGSYLGEDIKMQDRSGCLIYLNYESIIPLVGNIIFGLGNAARMIGKNCRAVGWFRRSTFQVVDLDIVEIDGDTIRSYTKFWGVVTGLFLIILALMPWFFSQGITRLGL